VETFLQYCKHSSLTEYHFPATEFNIGARRILKSSSKFFNSLLLGVLIEKIEKHPEKHRGEKDTKIVQ
jgi:hypothetical protein